MRCRATCRTLTFLSGYTFVPIHNAIATLFVCELYELKNNLLISEKTNFNLPKLHAAQSKAIEPIVSKFNNSDWTFDSSKTTIASGISVSNPPRLQEIVDVIKESNGTALSSTDDEALKWHKILAKEEGIFSEKTCAFSFSALEKLVAKGVIKKEEKIVIPITGSGLKEPI